MGVGVAVGVGGASAVRVGVGGGGVVVAVGSADGIPARRCRPSQEESPAPRAAKSPLRRSCRLVSIGSRFQEGGDTRSSDMARAPTHLEGRERLGFAMLCFGRPVASVQPFPWTHTRRKVSSSSLPL